MNELVWLQCRLLIAAYSGWNGIITYSCFSIVMKMDYVHILVISINDLICFNVFGNFGDSHIKTTHTHTHICIWQCLCWYDMYWHCLVSTLFHMMTWCLHLNYELILICMAMDVTNDAWWYLWTLVPEAGIPGRDKWLHLTVFCEMQLFIPAWDTCFWCQSPHLWCVVINGSCMHMADTLHTLIWLATMDLD